MNASFLRLLYLKPGDSENTKGKILWNQNLRDKEEKNPLKFDFLDMFWNWDTRLFLESSGNFWILDVTILGKNLFTL